MNQIIIVGKMVRDPEIKTLDSGSTVLAFTVAVNRGDKAKTTDFIDCKAWGTKADFIAKYFVKGKPIGVTGKLITRVYDKADGTKGKATEVLVNDVTFVPFDSTAKPETTTDDEVTFA